MPIKNFEDILAEKKEKVWAILEPYLSDPNYPKAFRIPLKYRQDQKLHWDITTEYPYRKGKYVRPTLAVLTAQAMGVAETKILQTAAAMQISEDWLLVHDDFEDDSEFRRGKPTLHRIYGEKLAVNAGDALHAIMWKILFDNQRIVGKAKTFELMEEFYQMLMRTVLGQGVEIMWAQNHQPECTDEDWFFIADGKTSYYTIAAPMRLGAIAAGASKKQLELLAEFGKLLGRCYQLVDDILDVTSDFRQLKKQIAYNDLYEGKKTLILGHLLRLVNNKDKKRILDILAKPRNQKKIAEVKWIARKMNRVGSIDYARKIAKNLGVQAAEMFDKKLKFLSVQPARRYLSLGISFVLNRDF